MIRDPFKETERQKCRLTNDNLQPDGQAAEQTGSAELLRQKVRSEFLNETVDDGGQTGERHQHVEKEFFQKTRAPDLLSKKNQKGAERRNDDDAAAEIIEGLFIRKSDP